MWRIFGSSGLASVSLLLASSGGIAAPPSVGALIVLVIGHHLLLNGIARHVATTVLHSSAQTEPQSGTVWTSLTRELWCPMHSFDAFN
jgi:hypothetical protein